MLAVVFADVVPNRLSAEEAASVAPQESNVDVVSDEESAPTAHAATWFQSLEKAKEVSAVRRAPILVVAGAEWCAYCKELAYEMERPAVQRELEQWLPVHLDVDDSPRTARSLGISPVPAMRVLTPDGRVVASRDGVVPAIELADWLRRQRGIAAAEISDHLTSRGRPSGVELIRIVDDFGHRDSTIREAAIARLTAYPEWAATYVVTSFVEGSLSERLSARELLTLWSAPVDTLDPWQMNTFTEDRIAKLDEWLVEQKFVDASAGQLTVAQIVEIKRVLQMIPTVDPAAAIAMRSQLARFGDRALPFVLDAIQRTNDPDARSRLVATRYRIVASTSLALSWPGGLERLASADFSERVAAADELAERASRSDEKLLLALFSDANPLIRELALRILKRVSGQRANGALVKLLDDPDPNVRAAVLKELAEDPSSRLVNRIAAYVESEEDADLIVHAIRFLRAVNEPRSVDALLPLFRHASWRVRAEAADGVTKIAEDDEVYVKLPLWKIVQAYIALLKDEDSFVVARAAEGLRVIRYEVAIEPLIAAAEKHPEVASEIVEILANDPIYAKSYAFVARSVQHESPVVRAAAVEGLLDGWEYGFEAELQQTLVDQEQAVRITALNAIARTLADEIESGSESLRSSGPPTEELGNDDTKYDWSIRAMQKTLSRVDWVTAARRFLDRSPDYDYADIEERIAACCVGALLGDSAAVSKLMTDFPQADEPYLVIEILPQLTRPAREQLFLLSAKARIDPDVIESMADSIAEIDAPNTRQLLWDFLGQDTAHTALHHAFVTSLLETYFEDEYYGLGSADPRAVEACLADCQRYVDEGTHWQQVTAMYLAAFLDRDLATRFADVFLTRWQTARLQDEPTLRDEPSLIVALAAANVMLFCATDRQEANERAVQLLSEQQPEFVSLGLMYLSWESDGVDPWLVEYSYWVAWNEDDFYGESSVKPIVPGISVDIDQAVLRVHAASPDPRIAALAAYLLTLLGEQGYTETVVNGWRAVPDEEGFRQLAYRSAARKNTADAVAVVKQIYSAIQNEYYPKHHIPDFYWTIRTMTAPGALALRKRLRREFGADALR